MSSLRVRPNRVTSVIVAVLLVAAFMPIAPAHGAYPLNVYVDVATGSDTTGDGSAGNPVKSITKGMLIAGSGSTVWVMPGLYDPNPGTSNETFPIALKPGVMLVAPGGRSVTRIEAEGDDRVMTIINATVDTGVRGFTISGGSAIPDGAGIYIYRDQPTLAESGWPLIEDCVIKNCTTDGNGGGIAVYGAGPAALSDPLISGCIIESNTALVESPGTGGGGGLYAYWTAAAPLVWDTIIRDNQATHGGGAWCDLNTSFERCEIVGNDALSEAGGLGVGNGCEVVDCYIADNSAGWQGGGLSLNFFNGTITVDRTVIEYNTADGYGGGVMVRGAAHADLTNCVVAHNDATLSGGAIRVEDTGGLVCELSLAGCTVVGNTSNNWDGIYLAGNEHVTVTDSIIGHEPTNPSDASTAQDIFGAYTMSYSDSRDTDLTGTGVIHADPEFIDELTGDYELMLGSPCIDTGNPASALIDDALRRSRPEDGDQSGTARVDMGAYERPYPEVDRISGNNRYLTAGIMAQWREWPGTTAVIASGEGFADALSGSGLAGAYRGPLLLTAKSSCPGIVFDALQDAGISDVIIVGGTAVVTDAVALQLETAGYGVRRIAGSNRYATAALVATEIAAVTGDDFSDMAFLARGDDFADALAASPLAYAEATPVLLTATGSLPTDTRDAIVGLGITDVVVVGGTGAVSDAVKNNVDALSGVSTERVSSTNRYATAAAVAQWGVDNGFARWNQVGIATGTNFPDALAGGALCGVRRGVLLLTLPAALPAPTSAALSDNADAIVYAEVYGGPGVVTDAVKTAINNALGW